VTIGKLAQSAGVATSTVRFYERAGLLVPERRSTGNYRDYTARSVERLRFIRSAQAVGLRVRDIAELLDVTSSQDSPCAAVEELLQRRLADIRQRMKHLRRVERTLNKAIASCCTDKDPGLCRGVSKTCR
jgi:MerR family mercuric resistance operon transcriptional regulator